MANNKECKGCPFWKWEPRDRLGCAPGFHYCSKPDYCERFRKKKIHRESTGFITDGCIKDMHDSLPIEIFVNNDNEPHRVISTSKELEDYLFGALPYMLSSYYRHKDD